MAVNHSHIPALTASPSYPSLIPSGSSRFVCSCGSGECLGHLKGGFYLTREQMEWAIRRGYCTTFMREQFTRLLQAAAVV